MPLRTMAAGWAAVGLTLALATTASASVEVREDLRPGDLVHRQGVGLVVPEPGTFVTMHALLTDGAQTVTAQTRSDGTVVISEAGSPAEPILGPDTPDEPPLGRATPSCDDPAYIRTAREWANWKHVKWKSTFQWWFRASTTPSYMYADNTRDAVRRAVANIVGAHNDCDLEDYVSATQDFRGDTTTTPNISVDGRSCATGDGVSVVSFGYVDDSRLATTCLWGYDDGGALGRITSSDTRLNNTRRWYAIKPADCSGRWSVEAVMTHAFGHTFGLGNVGPESDHGWLTMSPSINGACQHSETTLGLGDVRGLQALY